jgi:Fic family protein
MVEDLCDYVNGQWTTRTALHLAAYVMWRLNWIHPFTDGNGRTSRAASYLVLCLRLGYLLPGRRTIPDQIAEDRTRYYKALEAWICPKWKNCFPTC